MITDETYRAAVVAAIQACGRSNGIDATIRETVDALTAADLKLRELENKTLGLTSEAQ